MADTFNVTAAYDKSSYNTGDTITVTISGGDVLTTTVQGQVGPLVLTITAADGVTIPLNVPQQPVSIPTSTPESVKITAVSDTSPTPRIWTISASGLSITATA
jgi:hypothetical protein